MGRRRIDDDEGKGGRRERIVYTSQGGHHEVGACITLDLSQEEDDGVLPRPVRRGLLWQQKDRFFSRWKERFFILTQVSGLQFETPKISPDMPRITSTASRKSHQESRRWAASYSRFYHEQKFAAAVIYLLQCKLSEVEEVSLLNKRGYLTVSITHSKVD